MNKVKQIKINQMWQTLVLILAFLLIVGFTMHSINNIRGAARVIHYTGFVGGATQMVIKEEMYGQKNDALILLLDEMVEILKTGGGEIKVPALKNKIYQENIKKIKKEWENIKTEIYAVREGQSSDLLYQYSEETYENTNLASFAAQAHMESYVSRIKIMMGLFYFIFFMILTLFLHTAGKNTKLKTKAEDLNRIAYYDPYVGIANKAYCEKKMSDYARNSYENHISVIMFDLNNLKVMNDKYGHAAGDALIRNFALALDTIGREYGFVGRFGGDEFLAIFENCDEEETNLFLKKLVRLLQKVNQDAVNPWDKISCAAGYSIGYNGDKKIQQLRREADERMYKVKEKMKQKKAL